MSYHLPKINKTAYAVQLQVASDSALTSGDAIPYAVGNGTTSHGITASSGVITLPKGDWVCSFTADSISAFEGQIYVDGTANTTFPKISNVVAEQTSNLDSTGIPIYSTGSTTVEIRVDGSITILDSSDCVIVGVKL